MNSNLDIMKIILATNNQSKAEQIRQIFEGSGLTLLTQNELGITGEAVEDGDTLEDNALKKCIYVWQRSATKQWVIADDTGIFTATEPEWPGVKSARWAGDVSTEDTMRRFLHRMRGWPDRRATFRTSVVLVSPDQKYYAFSGECPGTVLESPQGRPQPQMPYSSIFKPDASDKVWSEMGVEEENSISHRGIAFRKALDFLKTLNSVRSFKCP